MNGLLFLLFVFSPWTPFNQTEILSYDQHVTVAETQGTLKEEGVVQTKHRLEGNQKYTLRVQIKGEGEVVLVLREFDEKGDKVREKRTDPLVLSDRWKGGDISFVAASRTKGIHVFILQTQPAHVRMEVQDLELKKS